MRAVENNFNDHSQTFRKKTPLFNPCLSFVVRRWIFSKSAGGMNISSGRSGFIRTVSRSSHLRLNQPESSKRLRITHINHFKRWSSGLDNSWTMIEKIYACFDQSPGTNLSLRINCEYPICRLWSSWDCIALS